MCVNLERKMLHLCIPLCHALCHDTRRVLRSKAPHLPSHVCVCVFVLQDLKDEKKKARMAAARAVLEKCTMMLLTASKVNSWPA